MNVHELPMILFTVIAQLSVGTFIVLGAMQLIASIRHDRQTVERLTEPVVYAIGPAMVFGLAVSTLHMNDITNTMNVFRHLGSSWLSREILFGTGFAALGFAFALVQWFNIGTFRLRQAMAALTALVGIALVWSMAQIYYSLPTVPAWNTPIVPFHFFATTLMLGALATGCALTITAMVRRRRETRPEPAGTDNGAPPSPAGPTDPAPPTRGGALATVVRTRVSEINAPTTTTEWALVTRTIQALAFTTAALGVAILISYPLHIAALSAGDTTAQASAQVFTGAFFTARLILLALAAVVLALIAYRAAGHAAREHPGILATLMTTAFTLAVITEITGRSLHYDSMLRIGM